jgi:lysophospholipase L1-like esterase
VLLDDYERTYRQLLEQTRTQTAARLILMEPYVIAPPVQGDAEHATGLSLAEAQRVYNRLREAKITEGAEWDACHVHFRALMDRYIAVVRRLAAESDAVLVRTQAAFDEAIAAQPPSFWAADRVHPNTPGHAVIARAWLRAIGYGDV